MSNEPVKTGNPVLFATPLQNADITEYSVVLYNVQLSACWGVKEAVHEGEWQCGQHHQLYHSARVCKAVLFLA